MARRKRAKDQFRGKVKPGDRHAQQPRRRANAKGSGKRQGGFGGFLAAAGAVAAVCVGILFQQSRAHRQQRERDAQLLAKMRRLPLTVTEHADCRMDCRHISREEVDAVLTSGSINSRKSEPGLRPCPKYVIDGSPGGKNVQCVVSACPQATNLVTVIDLDTDWTSCYCP